MHLKPDLFQVWLNKDLGEEPQVSKENAMGILFVHHVMWTEIRISTGNLEKKLQEDSANGGKSPFLTIHYLN